MDLQFNEGIEESVVWQDGYDAGYMQGLRSAFRIVEKDRQRRKAKADNLD